MPGSDGPSGRSRPARGSPLRPARPRSGSRGRALPSGPRRPGRGAAAGSRRQRRTARRRRGDRGPGARPRPRCSWPARRRSSPRPRGTSTAASTPAAGAWEERRSGGEQDERAEVRTGRSAFGSHGGPGSRGILARRDLRARGRGIRDSPPERFQRSTTLEGAGCARRRPRGARKSSVTPSAISSAG